MTTKNENFEAFVDAYVECALWSSTDDDGEPLDGMYSAEDISDMDMESILTECEAFIEANEADLNAIDQDYSQSGHDFWLTRNRHGAGFWDRYYGDNKELRAAYDRLSDASKVYGECNLYVGDDEKIYIS